LGGGGWGGWGSVDHMKISWVDWTSVSNSKKVGGLGVRRIRELNIGKWCWQMLEEREALLTL